MILENLRNGLLRRTLSVLLAMTITLAPCQAAIEFDGVDDYINLGNDLSLVSDEYTWSAWVKPSDLSIRRGILMRGGPAGDPPYNNHLSIDTNGAAFYVIELGAGNYEVNSAIGDINIGSWSHVTASFKKNTQAKLFVDGIYKDAIVIPNISPTQYNLYISNAAVYSHWGGAFAGAMDDVRIYNRELTNGEVLALYNSHSKRPSGSLANGLVAHYQMDDDGIGEVTAQAKDDSGNLNHGQFIGFDNLVSNGFSSDVPANIGNGTSLEFDGVNDYVNFNAGTIGSTILSGTKAVTITAWIKSTALDTAKYDNVVFVSRVGPATNANIWLNIRGDGVDSRKVLIGGRSQNADSFQEKTSTTALTSNTWTHVTGILDYENDEINLAIDGNLETATPVIFGSSTYVHSGTPTQPDSISSTNYVATYPFTGLIKDVRIYNKVLSLPEISFLYNGSGLNPGTSNLQALWTFDDNSALKDSSGNNNHGVGVGGNSLRYSEGVLRR